MLKYGNLEFRNLQEQVEENMKDIEKLKSGQAVLDEFGIKVVGEVESVEDMPTVAEYKEEVPDWEYGDTFAVGTEAPYTMYILTRANGEHESDYWFNIGDFPAPGPQGPQGPQGPEGQQGQTGDTGPAGADAGFGTPTATATMTARGSAPTVNVTATGPNTEKVFNFDFYLPVATPKVTITSASGTLTLAEYNILFNFEDSVVVFKPSSSLAHNAYTLQRWYSSDDYIVFICLYNYTPYKTGVYRCRVDRSNRNYLIYADEAIKINKYNISSAIDSTTNETAGKVLTADGNGGASWEDASGSGLEVVTLTQSTSTLSDDDYNKLNGDNAIIKFVSSADGWTKYFKKYKDDGTYIYYYQVSQEDGSGTFFGGFRIVKSTKYCASLNSYLKVSTSNINSGSTIANQYLTSNGSGGASWTSGPSRVQSDWNESSQSSPAYIKNKPTIPTVPVTDVTVNGTSVMDGTTAKVLVDTVDGATDGTNWTSLTINGTTAAIPQGSAQVQADWTESDTSDPSYIQNKPTLATVATSGSYNDLTNKPTIPSVSGSYSGDYWTSINLNGTSKSLVAAGALHYQGQVGTSADITWTNLISSSKSVKAGDFWYVKTTRVFGIPTASTGNLLIATTDGTGTSTTWKVLPTTDKTGTVTSVRVQATAPVQSSTSTAQSTSLNTTISLASEYGDTQNPYGSKTANYVLAAPNGSAGTPSFRALVKADLPTLTASDVGALPDSTTIPTKTSDLTNDSGFITGITSTDITTALGYTPYSDANPDGYLTSVSWDDVSSKPSFATVATSGSYADLSNKPTIPDAVSGTNDGTNWTSLTIGSDTYSIPAGGGSQKYLHHMTLVIKPSNSDKYMTSFDYISTSNTSLAEHGTAGSLSSGMKGVLTALNSYGTQAFDEEGITPAIQLNHQQYPSYLYYREGFGFYYIDPLLNSSGVATYQAMALGSSTSPYDITDNVQTL